MGSKGIFDNLDEFITAGGHIESAIILGGATGIGRVRDYISRHVPTISGPELDGFVEKLRQSGEAARIYNELGNTDRPDPNNVPEFPTQFGEDRHGQRVIEVYEVWDGATGQWRIVRTSTEDFYTRDEMKDLLDLIIRFWKVESPGRFNGMFDSEVEQEAFRQLYSFKAF